jgi:hypothetical protein
MAKESKSAQLQFASRPRRRAALECAARKSGLDMPAYVLSLVLPELSDTFLAKVDACRDQEAIRYSCNGRTGMQSGRGSTTSLDAHRHTAPGTLFRLGVEYPQTLFIDSLAPAIQKPQYIHRFVDWRTGLVAKLTTKDLRRLNVESYETALEITRYYPPERFPRKSLYALQEILPAAE